MGRYVFNLPDIGEGIAEAEIVEWHVKLGDMVEEDARIADMMTDKATVEMESPVSGKVIEVAGEAGDVIAIGSPLVVIEVEGEGNEAGGSEPKQEPEVEPEPELEEKKPARAEPEHKEPLPEREAAGGAQRQRAREERATPETEVPPPLDPLPTGRGGADKVLASPAVRKRAKDLGIDLAQVKPAEDGRVRHGDLDAFLSYNAGGGFSAAGRARADEQVKVIGLRRKIAENMAASKRHIPHFAYVEEYDVTALEEARAQLNADRGDRPKLTLLPFLITAICRLIPDFPMLNAHYDDEAGVVTRFGAVHAGIATQTDAGLMVAVVRDAQSRNLWQLASEIARLAEAARDGTAKKDELTGSTLTITSLGPMGGIATTPVINRPEVAIIGPNNMVERPMFVRDATGQQRIEARLLMNISMSCDHRVVDGYDAASFAQELKKLIENPARLLAG